MEGKSCSFGESRTFLRPAIFFSNNYFIRYGSVLGATFAAMFPVRVSHVVLESPLTLNFFLNQDKVERIIIDGVVDSENYYASSPFFPTSLPVSCSFKSIALWSNNLLDSNKTLQAFFDGCSAAGPDGCPFYAPTPEAVSQNLTNLYTTIRNKPVPAKFKESYGFVDYARVRAAVFTSLNSPIAYFPLLARGLADLVAGDGSLAFALTQPPTFECSCGDGPENVVVPELDVYARATISCNDGIPVPDSLEDYRKYFAELYNSSSFADVWGVLRAECM